MPSCLHYSGTHSGRGQTFAPDLFIPRRLGMALLVLFLISGLQPVSQVQGQAAGTLQVMAPDMAAFPLISVQFKLPDGAAVPGEDLLGSQVQLLEDGRQVPIESLQKERRGVHFTLAINGGRDFDLRDSSGSSNYAKMRAVLQAWVLSQSPSQGNAWSLITNEGRNLFHGKEVGPWLDALMAYAPDFRTMTSNLETLSAAVQSAATRVVPFGVDKSILYLTTTPRADEINRIQDLAEQARSAGIQVNVWMIGDPLFLNNDQGGALIALAEQTGGDFYQFFGTETQPDPESFYASLGFVHIVQYESQLRQTGAYRLRVQVNGMGSHWEGESPQFYLDVQPPDVVLFDPPRTLHRRILVERKTTGALVGENLQSSYFPDLQPVEFQVSFPDGIPREIVASRLYVNGREASVKAVAPFSLISWDLSEVLEPGDYRLQVEVTDSLGLNGLSAEFPVEVFVDLPQVDPEPTLQQMTLLLSGIILGLGVIALLAWFVFWLARKFNHQQLKEILSSHFRTKNDADGHFSNQSETVFASLIPIGQLEEGWLEKTIRITKRDGVFSGQPGQGDFLVQAAGVDRMQARLRLNDQGFWLQDLDSRLGTWVNYQRMGKLPVKIAPGDIIHFGNHGFRFTMMINSLPDRIRISPYEPIL